PAGRALLSPRTQSPPDPRPRGRQVGASCPLSTAHPKSHAARAGRSGEFEKIKRSYLAVSSPQLHSSIVIKNVPIHWSFAPGVFDMSGQFLSHGASHSLSVLFRRLFRHG